MDWHYAVGGNQKGPVSEQEFQGLVQQGVVTPQTLIWREGMTAWEPYGGNAPPLMIHNPAPDFAICAGCGGSFPGSEVIALDGRLYCATCKPLAVQRLREGVISPATTAAEEIRRQHLKHEASVTSIGFLYYLGGLALFVMATVAIFARRAGSSAGLLTIVVFFALSIAQFTVGTGLRRLKPWARIPTAVLSGIGLLGFPVGTLINAYILYLVLSKKGKMVFSEEYRAIIDQTPHIKYRTSVIVWILLGLVLLVLALALTVPLFIHS